MRAFLHFISSVSPSVQAGGILAGIKFSKIVLSPTQCAVLQAIRQAESSAGLSWITQLYSWLLLRGLIGSLNHMPVISSANSCWVTPWAVSPEHAFAFFCNYGQPEYFPNRQVLSLYFLTIPSFNLLLSSQHFTVSIKEKSGCILNTLLRNLLR